jgi:hypothetical protein
MTDVQRPHRWDESQCLLASGSLGERTDELIRRGNDRGQASASFRASASRSSRIAARRGSSCPVATARSAVA